MFLTQMQREARLLASNLSRLSTLYQRAPAALQDSMRQTVPRALLGCGNLATGWTQEGAPCPTHGRPWHTGGQAGPRLSGVPAKRGKHQKQSEVALALVKAILILSSLMHRSWETEKRKPPAEPLYGSGQDCSACVLNKPRAPLCK